MNTETILHTIKKFIPKKVFRFFQPYYHLALAYTAAILYRFPSRHITVVAITGTKGKSSTTELVNSILESAGYTTAVASTIRFKVGPRSEPNMHKMTMPGRFFIQHFLRRAVREKCDYAIIEMTSEAAKAYRHVGIALDALIFLNLAPEHIESHGSYEKYVEAKLTLATALERSSKPRTILVANTDDKEAPRFLAVKVQEKYPFTLSQAAPWTTGETLSLTFQGTEIHSPLRGRFNVYNILAAATYALTQNVPLEKIKEGIEKLKTIPGRVQYVATDPVTVVVDYAHTSDSLRALYESFVTTHPDRTQRIAVLGNTGGGRDTWKRGEMARIAAEYCGHIILTNEDPYDDDPRSIVEEMAKAIPSSHEIILDRRAAIHEALRRATGFKKAVVLITGKGTDPYIMGANNSKIPWNDARVASEELAKVKAGA